MIIDKEKKIVRINVHASNMIIYKKVFTHNIMQRFSYI